MGDAEDGRPPPTVQQVEEADAELIRVEREIADVDPVVGDVGGGVLVQAVEGAVVVAANAVGGAGDVAHKLPVPGNLVAELQGLTVVSGQRGKRLVSSKI